MVCTEDTRLRLIYEASMRVWNLNCSVLDGVRISGNTYRHRKDLLNARLRAANELYDHSVTCPDCKARLVTRPANVD